LELKSIKEQLKDKIQTNTGQFQVNSKEKNDFQIAYEKKYVQLQVAKGDKRYPKDLGKAAYDAYNYQVTTIRKKLNGDQSSQSAANVKVKF